MECYEEIANQVSSKAETICHQNTRGFFFIVLEVGHTQSNSVKEIFLSTFGPQLQFLESKLDLDFIERCLVFKYSSKKKRG